ncbi:MAG: OmpA family protein [Acidimicrobiia bacterium]
MTTAAHLADLRRKRTILIWLASVAWLALVFFAVASTRAPIENDLTRRSTDALTAAGIEGAGVTFEGRDATLSGTAATETEAQSAESVVLGVDGVRVVNNELTVGAPSGVAPPPTIPPPTVEAVPAGGRPPSFVMLVSGGTVALTGSVPDEETRDALVAGGVAAFGLQNVVNTLSVDEGVGSREWLAGLPFLIGEFEDVTEFSLVIAGGTAELSGLAVSEVARSSIENLVSMSLPDIEVVNLLEVGVDERELVQKKVDRLDLTLITFSVGSSQLEPGSTSVLDELAVILIDHSDMTVEIGGHTDATGTEESNLEISQGRAEAVVQYLVEHGISEARLTAVGYGSSDPIGDNFTAEGRAQNRRIEVTVLP